MVCTNVRSRALFRGREVAVAVAVAPCFEYHAAKHFSSVPFNIFRFSIFFSGGDKNEGRGRLVEGNSVRGTIPVVSLLLRSLLSRHSDHAR